MIDMYQRGSRRISIKIDKNPNKNMDWLNKHSMDIESPIAKDTLLVPDRNNPGGTKVRINKILLQISVRELYNDMLSEDPMVGLPRCRDDNGNILISDWKLQAMLPPHLRMMSDRYKIMCGCEYCIQMYNVHQNYN